MNRLLFLLVVLVCLSCTRSSQPLKPKATTKSEGEARIFPEQMTEISSTGEKNIQYGEVPPDSKSKESSYNVKGSFTIQKEAYGPDEGPGPRHINVAVRFERNGKSVEFTSTSQLSQPDENGEYKFDLHLAKPSRPGLYEIVVFVHTRRYRVIVDRKEIEITK